MEDENNSVNNQAVAEPENNVVTDSNDPVVNTGVKDPDVVEPGTNQGNDPSNTTEGDNAGNSGRDYEKDTAFKRMRLAEEAALKKAEAAERERDRLAATFKQFGYEGSTDDIIDKANAHYYGKTVEQVRAERLAQAQKEAAENSMKSRLEYYEQKEIQEAMSNDLKEIQKLNPEIQSFDDLPQEFFDLVGKGIEGPRAYKLLEVDGLFGNKNIKAEQSAIKKIQANGKASVGTLGNGQPDPNTSFATMSDEEFDKYYQKALRGELKG